MPHGRACWARQGAQGARLARGWPTGGIRLGIPTTHRQISEADSGLSGSPGRWVLGRGAVTGTVGDSAGCPRGPFPLMGAGLGGLSLGPRCASSTLHRALGAGQWYEGRKVLAEVLQNGHGVALLREPCAGSLGGLATGRTDRAGRVRCFRRDQPRLRRPLRSSGERVQAQLEIVSFAVPSFSARDPYRILATPARPNCEWRPQGPFPFLGSWIGMRSRSELRTPAGTSNGTPVGNG